MSIHRYAARRDANEPPIVNLARQLGALMERSGPLDWWCAWRGQWIPVEIKMPKGKYTDAQVLFLARAKERALPVWTWRDANDVMDCLGATRGA